jgi:hypothetical protein
MWPVSVHAMDWAARAREERRIRERTRITRL